VGEVWNGDKEHATRTRMTSKTHLTALLLVNDVIFGAICTIFTHTATPEHDARLMELFYYHLNFVRGW